MKPPEGHPAGGGAPARAELSGGVERSPEAPRTVLLIAAALGPARPVMERLTSLGWAVTRYRTVRDGVRALDSAPFDAVLLDQSTEPPGQTSGQCRALRHASHLPLLVLAGGHHVQDRVAALDAGADVVVPTPVDLDELTAELRALTRRQLRPPAPSDDWIAVGALRISSERRDVRIGEASVTMTLREFDLLHFLVANQGRTVTRPMALDAVWGWESSVSPTVVDVYIGYLRRKLADPASGVAICTMRGVGYRLQATGTEPPAADPRPD